MTPRRFLIPALLACAIASARPVAVQAADQRSGESPAATSQPFKPNPSLVQRLRRWLNLTPPLAVGGSRGLPKRTVCLLSPPVQRPEGDGLPLAVTALAQPTLLTAEPLNELRIVRDGQILWRQRGSSTQPLQGPIAWPLAPLQPGERLTLWLRPQGSAGGDFAQVQLQAGDAAQLQQGAALLADPRGLLAAVETAAAAGEEALALELLQSPQQQEPPQLTPWRQAVAEQACGLKR